MYHTGIADEAGKDLATQIKAHKELGWSHIELRIVNGTQFTDVTDAEFEAIRASLDGASLKVSCFGSAIANWACKISEPPEKSVETLKRVIPRMQRLGTRFIRTMSWPNDGLSDADWGDEVVRRYKTLAAMAEDGGIVLAVENCDGWASQTPETYRRFFERVGSPAVRAVYDTGNPAGHLHTDTWQWYTLARPFIDYVHIKSHTGPMPEKDKQVFTWPGEGASLVIETLTDLFKTGYDGGLSIEPHLKAVVHEHKGISDAEAAYRTYVEYGRRTMDVARNAMAAAGW